MVELRFSFTGSDAAEQADRIIPYAGTPLSSTVDHGTNFTSKALVEWVYRKGDAQLCAARKAHLERANVATQRKPGQMLIDLEKHLSTLMDDEIRRWTARRKSALVLQINATPFRSVSCAAASAFLVRHVLEADEEGTNSTERFAQPLKQMIEENPSSATPRCQSAEVHREHVTACFPADELTRKRSVGFRPRARTLLPVASAPNER